jgi:hypothetical protein
MSLFESVVTALDGAATPVVVTEALFKEVETCSVTVTVPIFMDCKAIASPPAGLLSARAARRAMLFKVVIDLISGFLPEVLEIVNGILYYGSKK